MPIQYPYDASLLLHDGAAAVTADTGGQVASAAKIFDTESTTSPAARWPMAVVINVSARDATTGDETYDIAIQGSNAADFGSGVRQLGSIVIDATGRYTLLFDNEQTDTVYRYLRLYVDVGGTTPSLTFTAFMAPAVVV